MKMNFVVLNDLPHNDAIIRFKVSIYSNLIMIMIYYLNFILLSLRSQIRSWVKKSGDFLLK